MRLFNLYRKSLSCVTLAVIGMMILTSISFAQVGFGHAEKINQNWKFVLQDVENGEQSSIDDGRWRRIDLPHDWSVKQQLSPTLASATGYLPGGIGWYRKQLFVPQEKLGGKVYLYFEGVYNRSEVFVNGRSLGERPNGYISFAYDATPYINFGEDNLIAVRVDHSQSADSRWYTGSGIYRDVWVVYANPVHIDQWGVYAYPEKQEKGYNLNVEVEALNETNTPTELLIQNELISPSNQIVANSSEKLEVKAKESGKIKALLKVASP